MGDKRPYKPRKPGAGRKPLKPNYDAAAILQEQIQAAVVLYEEDNSLQTIADTVSLNPIKVRKLLITAGVYESEIAAVMLQRQQAYAIIDARKMIVDGAVGMVEMALERLNENRVVELDEERKAAMVSNLLVVLCGNHDTQPIVNTGSLY